MITYLNILFLAFITSVGGISCEKEVKKTSDSFYYGIWNEIKKDQSTIAFYYAEGFELASNGNAIPRYDDKNEGNYKTSKHYIGSWSYHKKDQELSFTEEGSKFPAIYNVEALSDNKIKLTNPNTGVELIYQRE